MPDTKINSTQSENKQAKKTVHPPKTIRKKSLFRRIQKYIVFLIITFIAVFIFLFLFVQTERFNTWLLDYSFNQINDAWSKKESRIYAETLRGNIFTGLRLYNGNITVKNDTLLKFANIQVKYNVLGLLRKEIIVSSLTLNEPQINLTKVNDENGNPLWNLEYLLRSEKKEVDTTKKKFDWEVKAEQVKINNGSIRMLANKPQNAPVRSVKMNNIDSFDLDYLDINNLQVDLYATYSPDFKNLHLGNLSFNTNSDFSLKKLSFDAEVNENDSTSVIRTLELKTSRTQLNADIISMDHFEPLAGVEYDKFKNNNVKIDMASDKFNFDDLKFFIPQINFLNNTVSFEINAHGKYGKLTIDKLVIHTPGSYINIKGRVDNLNDPGKLYFDVTGNNMVLDASDTKTVLPGLPIPDYSHIGKVDADIKYTGEPLNFKTEFDIRSGSGNASGTLALNLNDPQYRYDGKIETTGLDIGAIIKNEELKSSINTRAEINGTGFDLNTISAKVTYDLVNSKIYNHDIMKSAGTMEIHNRELTADLSLQSDRIQTSLKGRINLANTSDAEYTMKGAVKDLDISEFTKHSSDKSNLNFSFDINGKGASLDNIEGTYDLNFNHSYYAAYNIPPSPVLIKIDNSKTNSSINVTSDFFDFKAKGTFTLEGIAGVINDNIHSVTAEVMKKFGSDSLSSAGNTANFKNNVSDLNLQYEFTAKNILPLSKMFDTTGFFFKGDIKGSMSNSIKGFSALADFNIKDFAYTDTSLAAKSLQGSFVFTNDYTKPFISGDGVLYPVYSKISVVTMGFQSGNFKADSLNAGLILENGDQKFHIYGIQDTTLALNLSGDSHLENNLIDLNLDTLVLGYHQKDFKNTEQIQIIYNPAQNEKTFTFKQFGLGSSIMNLNISGDLSLKDSSNLDIEGKSIKIGQLTELLYPGYADYTSYEKEYFKSPIRGNIRRISATFRGNPSNPVVSLEMNTDLIRYERIRVGRVDAFIDYSNSILSTDVLVSNAAGNGRLRLTGDIPAANPFAPIGPGITTSLSENPVNVKLTASNFQLNFFSRLLPKLGDISGLLNGEITSTGSVQKPVLAGDMNITDGRFLLGVTGLYHRFNAKFRAENSNLIVDNFRIMNIDDDRRHIDFWGNINFEGLKLNDINLTSSGDLVVLDQSALDNDIGLSGDMVVGVGSPAVTLTGNFKSLSLSGQFLIKSADVKVSTIPGSSYDISSDNFVYKILKDTTGVGYMDTVIEVSPQDFAGIDPFLRSNVIASSKPKTSEFNIHYDLNVKTVKDASVSIMFNNLTKEELFGQLSADLNVTNKNTGLMQVYGNLDVTGDSYYRFYRNFKVKDSHLTFIGPPSNPELNIHAVYENKPSNEAIGGTISSDVIQIVLEIHGTKNKPVLTLKLYQGGNEVTGSDAQSDAISYLFFGVSKNQLVSGQRSTLAGNIGATTSSAYLSSLFGNAMRDIAPFITSAEVNYSEGSIATGTDIRITSEVGDATVRFGGKIFSGLGNAEVVIEYPLNRLLNINVSNNLIIEVSRIVDESGLNGGRSVHTGAKLSYKLRF